jgi:putative FmdB family regulatory protein
MPTYEYECKSCSHNFEVFQSMSDAPIKNCPECGGEVRRLIFGGAGVIFKGSGFYVTDKGKAANTGKKEKTAGCANCPAKSDACPAEASKSSSTETKPETKSA